MKIIKILFILFFPSFLFAQKISNIILEVDINMRKEGFVAPKKVQQISKDSLSKVQIEVNNGALIIHYDMESRKRELFMIDLVGIQLMEDSSYFELLPNYVYGLVQSPKYSKAILDKSITVDNPPDNRNYKYLIGKVRITLKIQTELSLCNIDCNKPPEFNFWKHVAPEAIGTLAGGLVLYASLKPKRDSKEIYKEQYVIQDTEEMAKTLYERVQDKRKMQRNREWVGASMISAGILSCAFRNFILRKKKMRCYESECGRKVSFSTYYENDFLGHSGISFIYRF